MMRTQPKEIYGFVPQRKPRVPVVHVVLAIAIVVGVLVAAWTA